VQLQLSLTLADDLHDLLLLTGESLDYLEAAERLLALRAAPASLCHQIMATLVGDDRRFCWTSPTTIGLADFRRLDLDLSAVPFVVVDLETTGARPGPGKITEIGAVRIEGLQQVGTFETLVNPLRPIPHMIVQITGITPQMVRSAPRIEQVMPHFLDFTRDAVIVAHNAAFDLGFLNYELTRLRGSRLGEGAIDTVSLARYAAPGLTNYKLGTVAEAMGSPVVANHRALADAEATAHVFLTLVGRLQEQGITTLDQLRAHVDPSQRRDRHKIALTRDLPRTPGAYLFLATDGEVLYVGKAERLRDRVRSYFLPRSDHPRKVRQAMRRLDRVTWEETGSPLAAVVREQELILEHRPSANVHGRRPENYLYLKVARHSPGLRLYATNRLGPGRAGPGAETLVLGPFRGRARVTAALDLLRRCYPIRRCAGRPTTGPCLYGQTTRCLAPCTGDEQQLLCHDALVEGLVDWMTGEGPGPAGDDPMARGRHVMHGLAAQHRYEEAQEVQEALDDLAGLRRSYLALHEARQLCVGVITPSADPTAQDAVHLDVVWRGALHASLSLTAATAALEIGRAVRSLQRPEVLASTEGGSTSDAPRAGATSGPVAVAQDELDLLLAVRRWIIETPEAVTVPYHVAREPDKSVAATQPEEEALEIWRRQMLSTAMTRLAGRV